MQNILVIPLFLGIISTGLITNLGIYQLTKFQLKQIIRQEGPKAHYKKSGTPNMGGLIIIPVGLIIGNLININNSGSEQLIAISLLTILFMLIGAIDDFRSISRKHNTGLSPQIKLLLQIVSSSCFLIFSYYNKWVDPEIYLFHGKSLLLGSLLWPFALFVLVAESNATNLTDGLDGLASGCGAILLTGLSIELILQGNDTAYTMASFCMAMAGSWLGFLLHNKNPAKIFMGDTGSLAMGASIAGVSLISNTLLGLLLMGIIFLGESLSVIIQVLFFKISKRITGKGRRVFLMAPLHHHFELKGHNEIEIVKNFWLISIACVCLRLLFL